MTNIKLICLLTLMPPVALLLGGCASTAASKPADARLSGYVHEGQQQIVRTGTNQCLRTGTWSGDSGVAECEPQTVARAPVEQPQPAQTEAAPPAEPATAEAEPQIVVARVYVGADAYFDFDQATLAPEARSKLDNVVARVRESREPMIEITGYADPIGSEQYNMELSQRRADAVRAYLIDQGVPDDTIRIEARGESNPVVRCEGRQGEELIQCLQPDRVSEIIISVVEEVEAR